MCVCVVVCGRVTRCAGPEADLCVDSIHQRNFAGKFGVLPLESANRTHIKMHVHVSNVNTRGLCFTTTDNSFRDREGRIPGLKLVNILRQLSA